MITLIIMSINPSMNFGIPPIGLSQEIYGLLLIFVSALFLSMMGSFMKLSSESGIPNTELVFARSTFQTFFIILFMCNTTHINTPQLAVQVEAQAQAHAHAQAHIQGEDGELAMKMAGGQEEPKLLIRMPLGKSKEVIPTVIARGLMGALNFALSFYCMMALPLGDAMTLSSLHPIIAVFMARVFLDEQVRHSHILAAISTITGAILMVGPQILFSGENDEMEDEEEVNQLGFLAAILSSFCSAGSMVLIRRAGELGAYTSQLILSLSVFSGGSALLFGMTIGSKIEGIWITPATARIYWYMFAMCVTGAIDQLMINFAGRLAPAGLGSIARSSSILWGYVFETVIFHEIPSWSTAVGVIFILTALCTVSYEKIKDEQGIMLEEKESAFEVGYKNIEDTITNIPIEKGEHA